MKTAEPFSYNPPMPALQPGTNHENAGGIFMGKKRTGSLVDLESKILIPAGIVYKTCDRPGCYGTRCTLSGPINRKEKAVPSQFPEMAG